MPRSSASLFRRWQQYPRSGCNAGGRRRRQPGEGRQRLSYGQYSPPSFPIAPAQYGGGRVRRQSLFATLSRAGGRQQRRQCWGESHTPCRSPRPRCGDTAGQGQVWDWCANPDAGFAIRSAFLYPLAERKGRGDRMQEPILIKRYAGSRLYDTSKARYVTVEELRKWSRAGDRL
jgi:hypothetical protein